MGIFNLTESEKKEILSLHNNAKVIKEQVETQQAAPTTQPSNPIDKIKLIQTTLITKYNVELGKTGSEGDGVDGKLGPKTLSALLKVVRDKQISNIPKVQSAKINPTVASTPLAANTTQIQSTQLPK